MKQATEGNYAGRPVDAVKQRRSGHGVVSHSESRRFPSRKASMHGIHIMTL
jgi:hypothetical protein